MELSFPLPKFIQPIIITYFSRDYAVKFGVSLGSYLYLIIMKKEIEADLLKSAINIGECIIDAASLDSNGIHWRTVNAITSLGDVETSVNETIATGTSGILLFYIELYKVTRSPKYLDYINSSADWISNYCSENPAHHGFYSGRIGAAITLFKIFHITGLEKHRKMALEVTAQFKNITAIPINHYNLQNGLAGTVLGLLYLYPEIKQSWLLDSIYNGIEILLNNVKLDNTGLYWDTNFFDGISINTKPLCGFAFGAGGVGLLFIHLSECFKNSVYASIGLQALQYEDQFYNGNLNNWPDFRLSVKQKNGEKLKSSYLKGDYSSFDAVCFNTDWMHGSIGQLYVRLSAENILKGRYKNAYTDKNLAQLNKTSLDAENYTLATGGGGLGLFLLKLSLEKGDSGYYNTSLALAKASFTNCQSKRFYQFGFSPDIQYEDNSLLMGVAGIGYYYLQLLSKDEDCILFPDLKFTFDDGQDHNIYKFSTHNAASAIVQSLYPNTLRVLKTQPQFELTQLSSDSLKSLLKEYIKTEAEEAKQNQVDDAYRYDSNKLLAQDATKFNNCLYSICRQVEISKNKIIIENSSKQKLLTKRFKLNRHSYFIKHTINWKNTASTGIRGQDAGVYTLFSLGEEFTLSAVQFEVISCFSKPQLISNVYRHFLEKRTEDADYLKHSFFDMIKFFLIKGILNHVDSLGLIQGLVKPKEKKDLLAMDC